MGTALDAVQTVGTAVGGVVGLSGGGAGEDAEKKATIKVCVCVECVLSVCCVWWGERGGGVRRKPCR